ncbi:MAG TPA: flagellar motor protein MotD, partial [Thiotrichales bacterium]|nr:flagellar motor protein MotD [Thiotrichales bacterium]
MGGRRRRQEDHDHDHENTDRWLVSYADFITLLFAFFVVMYSMSSINEGKYRVLSDTLVEAFKTPPKSPEPIQLGEPRKSLDPVDKLIEKPDIIEIRPEPLVDTTQTARIARQLQQSLKPLLDRNLIKIKHDKLWVEVELNNRILFASGEAELQPSAYPVLRQLARELKDLPNHIDVEGHTDNLPIRNEVFRSNWELSAARAASVVHLLTR